MQRSHTQEKDSGGVRTWVESRRDRERKVHSERKGEDRTAQRNRVPREGTNAAACIITNKLRTSPQPDNSKPESLEHLEAAFSRTRGFKLD